MRYPASEKLEIIRTVETSHLPVRRTLDKIGISKTTFYAWLDRYAAGGLDALEDRKPRPKRVWNRIPDEIRDKVIERALDAPELSPREVAVAFTDTEKTFVSEASVYRILKAEGLVTSPAFIVMKASDRFANPTTAINQLWQTDFTYLKVTGWGWFYLSTVLDDFSRYIVAWKLCTTMSAADVTDTLHLALQAADLDQVDRVHRPRLLSDNGPSYVAADLSDWLKDQGMKHTRGKPYHPMTQGKIERWDLSLKSRILLENYYLPGTSNAPSPTSSSTIITAAFTRAWTTSRPLTSTSGAAIESESDATRSNAEPSSKGADSTSAGQHEIQPDGPSHLLVQQLNCPENSDDGQASKSSAIPSADMLSLTQARAGLKRLLGSRMVPTPRKYVLNRRERYYENVDHDDALSRCACG